MRIIVSLLQNIEQIKIILICMSGLKYFNMLYKFISNITIKVYRSSCIELDMIIYIIIKKCDDSNKNHKPWV